MKKRDLILSLCGYIMLGICDIVLTIMCFMSAWSLGIFTLLFGGFIAILIISTIQQIKGKKPIIRQKKTDTSNAKILLRNKGINSFWKTVGILAVLDEMSDLDEQPPLKRKSILDSTCYDNEHLHTQEGHDTEDGYCMECDIAVEDIIE